MSIASVLMLQLEVSVELSLQAAREAWSRGAAVILDPGPVRPLPEEFYSYCRVITPNETEAQALVGFPVTGIPSAARAARILVDRGVEIAVIKLGAQGTFYVTRDGVSRDGAIGGEGQHVPAIPVQAVDSVDSVAAGDAFNGALAAALAGGDDLARAMKLATAAGALAVTKFGAQDSMPTKEDVEKLLGQTG